MQNKIICVTCGTQYATTATEGSSCPICEDERQYVPETGQAWTDMEILRQTHKVKIKELQPGLFEFVLDPLFAIGQRALFLVTPGGNILWDCIALLNDEVVSFINSKGGLKAIAFSHPHFFTTMNEWAATFNCQIYIHQSDDQWIFNKGSRIHLWEGDEKQLWDGVRILQIGGHFPGSSILHVPFLSPEGSIFVGDTFSLGMNKKHLSILYSYPNRIPLPISEVKRIRDRMETVRFDSLYAMYNDQHLLGNAKTVLLSSLDRYV